MSMARKRERERARLLELTRERSGRTAPRPEPFKGEHASYALDNLHSEDWPRWYDEFDRRLLALMGEAQYAIWAAPLALDELWSERPEAVCHKLLSKIMEIEEADGDVFTIYPDWIDDPELLRLVQSELRQ